MSALRLKLGLTALFAATSAPTLSQYPSASEPTLEASPIVVRGVSIVQLSEGTVSAPSDILISGGKIVEISPAGTLPTPTGAITIDGHNKFALPGLIDVHAHIGEGGHCLTAMPAGRGPLANSFVMA